MNDGIILVLHANVKDIFLNTIVIIPQNHLSTSNLKLAASESTEQKIHRRTIQVRSNACRITPVHRVGSGQSIGQ